MPVERFRPSRASSMVLYETEMLYTPFSQKIADIQMSYALEKGGLMHVFDALYHTNYHLIYGLQLKNLKLEMITYVFVFFLPHITYVCVLGE